MCDRVDYGWYVCAVLVETGTRTRITPLSRIERGNHESVQKEQRGSLGFQEHKPASAGAWLQESEFEGDAK